MKKVGFVALILVASLLIHMNCGDPTSLGLVKSGNPSSGPDTRPVRPTMTAFINSICQRAEQCEAVTASAASETCEDWMAGDATVSTPFLVGATQNETLRSLSATPHRIIYLEQMAKCWELAAARPCSDFKTYGVSSLLRGIPECQGWVAEQKPSVKDWKSKMDLGALPENKLNWMTLDDSGVPKLVLFDSSQSHGEIYDAAQDTALAQSGIQLSLDSSLDLGPPLQPASQMALSRIQSLSPFRFQDIQIQNGQAVLGRVHQWDFGTLNHAQLLSTAGGLFAVGSSSQEVSVRLLTPDERATTLYHLKTSDTAARAQPFSATHEGKLSVFWPDLTDFNSTLIHSISLGGSSLTTNVIMTGDQRFRMVVDGTGDKTYLIRSSKQSGDTISLNEYPSVKGFSISRFTKNSSVDAVFIPSKSEVEVYAVDPQWNSLKTFRFRIGNFLELIASREFILDGAFDRVRAIATSDTIYVALLGHETKQVRILQLGARGDEFR